MKRHGHLFEQVIDPENLSAAIDRAARGKKSRRTVAPVIVKKERFVRKLREMLLTGAYEVSPYRVRTIYEPKQRDIHILPFFPDRVVQHALMAVLEPLWDAYMVPQSYSCRVGKGQHRASHLAMRYVRQYKYVLQCDVRKFYHSLDHDELRRVVRLTVKDPRVLALLDKIIESFGGKGCPIGSLCSQWFGNLYMTGLDRMVLRERLAGGYVRYCDDFLMFSDSKEQLHEAGRRVTAWCAAHKLALSKVVLRRCADGLDFLGYRHFPQGYILLRKRTARRIRHRLVRLWHQVGSGQLRNPAHAVGAVASAIGWARHASCHNFSQHLHIPLLHGIVRAYATLEAGNGRLPASA